MCDRCQCQLIFRHLFICRYFRSSASVNVMSELEVCRWRRWRRDIFSRSSSAPSPRNVFSLGDFLVQFHLQELLDVFPASMPLRRFSRLTIDDITRIDNNTQRERALQALRLAREFEHSGEVRRQSTLFNLESSLPHFYT